MRVCILLLLALLGALAHAKPSVVVSIQPYADLVHQIAGNRADIITLLQAGSSPHTYDPSPRDIVRVAEADLIVLNGGLDAWLLDLVAASGSHARLVVAMSDLSFAPITGFEEHHAPTTGAPGQHAANPHIWLDPVLMARLAPKLGSALAQVDPKGGPDYRARAAHLADSLRSLDAELRQLLLPVRGHPFVPFHDAWPYFARRYHLDLIAEVEPAPGHEPGPRTIIGVIELIRETGARAVFGEVQLPVATARTVADGAEVPLYMLDPLGKGGQSYQDLLLANAHTIAAALEGR